MRVPSERCAAVMLAGVMTLAGCVSEDATKTSHFEHDHKVAAHWPSDLADAAIKIRERLSWSEREHEHRHDHEHDHEYEHDHDARSDPGIEIADIVSWVPEIAADTNLSEQDWIPLDNAAESLSSSLHASGNELTESNRRQALAFCELIERSLTKIPDQLP